jgi:hypothetical protein
VFPPPGCKLQARARSGRARQVVGVVYGRACERLCAPLLLYVLLYCLDIYASKQLGQTPVSHASSSGVGLFVFEAKFIDRDVGPTYRWPAETIHRRPRGNPCTDVAIVTQLVTSSGLRGNQPERQYGRNYTLVYPKRGGEP